MTWMQTRSGLAVDLARPDLSAIDMMTDIAIPLSLANRFAGPTGRLDGAGFSTAQHSYLGADAVLQETGGDTDAALAFLLHDAHEAFIGDLTAPFVASLILTGIHSYLGVHVVERGVIFVDLSLAQIAALGATIALLLPYSNGDPHAPVVYWISLAFTFIGAAIFATIRVRRSGP